MHSPPTGIAIPGSRTPSIAAVVVLLAASLVACAAPVVSLMPLPSPTPPDAATRNRATATAFVEALRANDAAAVAALFAPDGTFDDPPEHRPDRTGVQATYAEVFGYQQLMVDAAVVLVGEDGAVVSWTYRWCNTSIEPCPSQRVTRAAGVSILRMAEGVVTNETLYYIGGGEPN